MFLKKNIVLKISIIHILLCNLYKIQEDNNFVFLTECPICILYLIKLLKLNNIKYN